MARQFPKDTHIRSSIHSFSDDNGLDGPWPSEVCILTDLEKIAIQNNKLKGELPFCLTSLYALEDMNVGNNQFSGTLPFGFFKMPSLVTLVLSNNQFTGSLDVLIQEKPSETRTVTTEGGGYYTAFDKLTTLKLENNLFQEIIPYELFFLFHLETLTLHGNVGLDGNVDALCNHHLALLTADCVNVVCTCCTQCF